MKKIFLKILVLNFLSFSASANDLIFEMKLKYPSEANLKNEDRKNTKPSKELVELKKAEHDKKWAHCADISKNGIGKFHLAEDWILLIWMKCSRRDLEDSKNNYAVERLMAAFNFLNKKPNLLLIGAPRSLILQEMIRGRMGLAEYYSSLLSTKSSKINKSEIARNLDQILFYSDLLDKETRSRAYYYYAELAQNQHQLVGAKQFLEYSLMEKETRQALEKYSAIKLALGDTQKLTPVEQNSPEVNGNSAGNGANGVISNSGSGTINGNGFIVRDDEKKIEDRFNQSLVKNDLINAIEDGVSYLNEYPNGAKNKFISEKILDILNTFFERMNTSDVDFTKYNELRQRAFAIIDRLDFMRKFEWVKLLHRKGDYEAVLKLGEKSALLLTHSAQNSQLLWMLGRSAQFMGQYNLALKYFDEHILHHSSSEEASEVMFRQALCYLRMNQFSSAVAVLEKLMTRKSADKFDLSVRYWLVRALQQEKNPRSETESRALLDKYPYSYYALRLRAEQNQNILDLSEFKKQTAELEKTVFLPGIKRKQIEKIDFLTSNEWFLEASREIASIQTPKDGVVKILLGKKWEKSQAFPSVIRLTNEALELDTTLRNFDLIQSSYPNSFSELIQKESQKNKLSPVLVKSLIRQESAFGPMALSSSNAMGLMQIIPPTLTEIAQELKMNKFSIIDDAHDVELNIQMGTYYLAKVIKKFNGNVPMGLAAYNAGPHKLQIFAQARPEILNQTKNFSSNPLSEIWIDELPWSETSIYVKSILRNTLMYKSFETDKLTLSDVIWKDLSEISPEG